MATMTVHVFPTYAYHDQRQYMQRYLRKPPEIKVRSFTTKLIQLNTCLPYNLPDRLDQIVTSLPDDDIKGILYHTMEKENCILGIQLLRWSYQFYCRILQDKD